MKIYDYKALLLCVLVGVVLAITHYVTEPWGGMPLEDAIITGLTVTAAPLLMWLVRTKSAIVIGATIGLLLHYVAFYLVVMLVWKSPLAWFFYLNTTIWVGSLGALLSPFICNKFGNKQALKYGFISCAAAFVFAVIPLVYFIIN